MRKRIAVLVAVAAAVAAGVLLAGAAASGAANIPTGRTSDACVTHNAYDQAGRLVSSRTTCDG